jgi:hypothetical protein
MLWHPPQTIMSCLKLVEAVLERRELTELHYITPMANLASIMQRGLLCHHRVAKLAHSSVAMPELQDKRAKIVVPGGMALHAYVNLYICARNPMMYKRKDQHSTLCVLMVSPGVLDLPGVIVSDCNAASDYRRFAAAPSGLSIVDRELTFAEYWTDQNPLEKYRKAARKCAEVLVPDCVPARYITGAYVSCTGSQQAFDALQSGLACAVDAHLFFR